MKLLRTEEIRCTQTGYLFALEDIFLIETKEEAEQYSDICRVGDCIRKYIAVDLRGKRVEK
jgi:hypothetical protein